MSGGTVGTFPLWCAAGLVVAGIVPGSADTSDNPIAALTAPAAPFASGSCFAAKRHVSGGGAALEGVLAWKAAAKIAFVRLAFGALLLPFVALALGGGFIADLGFEVLHLVGCLVVGFALCFALTALPLRAMLPAFVRLHLKSAEKGGRS